MSEKISLVDIIGAISAAVIAVFAAYKTFMPVYMRWRESRQKLSHEDEAQRAKMDFAADKRISAGLRQIITYQTKQIDELTKKVAAQEIIILACIEDRAELRIKVEMLENRQRDANK